MEQLNYTTKEINGTFKIKVFGYNAEGEKLNVLVGVSGLIALLDGAIDLVNRLLDRAFRCKGDVCVCKLRRGIKISFYYY